MRRAIGSAWLVALMATAIVAPACGDTSCTSAADCGKNEYCAFDVDPACSGKPGVCTSAGECAGPSKLACGCDGKDVYVGCVGAPPRRSVPSLRVHCRHARCGARLRRASRATSTPRSAATAPTVIRCARLASFKRSCARALRANGHATTLERGNATCRARQTRRASTPRRTRMTRERMSRATAPWIELVGRSALPEPARGRPGATTMR